MELTLLRELLLLAGVAFVLTALSDRFAIPPVLSLTLGGILLGPAGLGIVSPSEAVELIATLGIALLLFTVGLDFSSQHLWQLRRVALIGGLLHMGLSTLVGATLWFLWRWGSPAEALAVGLLASLSSTAVGLGFLLRRGELEAPHGRLAFTVLLAQDVAVAPVLVLVRLLGLLAGGQTPSAWFLLRELVLILAAGTALFVLLRFAIRASIRLLRLTYAREAFVLLGLTVGIGAATLSASWGLSAALGAFAAGILFADFQERHRLMGVVAPFRDAFASLFFLSVGLLMETLPPIKWLVPLTLLLCGGKFVATLIPARLAGYPIRTAALSGILLASLGEFTIVGLGVGMQAGLFDAEVQHLLRAAFIGSILLTALLYLIAHRWIPPIPTKMPPKQETPAGHVLIVGYGVTGSTVHALLKTLGIPYAILELNPFTVARLQAAGEPVFLGDCTDETSLRHAGADRARAVVVAISDTRMVPHAIGLIRSLNAEAFIAARTRFVAYIEPLYAAGASVVVAEEWEASLYLLTLLLRHLQMPVGDIAALGERFRAEHYSLLQRQLSEAEQPSQ